MAGAGSSSEPTCRAQATHCQCVLFIGGGQIPKYSQFTAKTHGFWRNNNPQSFPQSFFPALLDEFTLDGPNGTHLCLVTEPLGLNLSTTLEQVKQLPLAVARQVAVQMIQAIVQLHEKGVVHGGMQAA
jgi:serine/threonine protein kinase